MLPSYKSKNHEVKLFKGKQASFVQNYRLLLEQETDAIKIYINKYLEKNFVRPNLSAVVAPLLLVRKPGSRLKFCIDYRAFNKIIVKN